MHNYAWLPPILVAAGIAVIGWLLRNAVTSITDRILSLEAAFTRVTADLAMQHKALEVRIENIDRRLVRVESWKEIISLRDYPERTIRHKERED
jgi:hypothetical protein